MPISRISWGIASLNKLIFPNTLNGKRVTDRHFDIHILRGQSIESIDDYLMFENNSIPIWASDYLSSQNDVKLTLTPLFKGVKPVGSDIYSGHGIEVNVKTGKVNIATTVPPIKKNNFIMVVTAENQPNGPIFQEMIRFHIHTSITEAWLTPTRLRVRPSELESKRFSIRAQFDDGSLADLTYTDGIVWGPHHVEPDGRFKFQPSDSPEDEIDVTATLPPSLGGKIARGTMVIDRAWVDEDPTIAAFVPGRSPKGSINPERVPNFLFLCDGFRNDDEAKFDTLVSSIVQHMRTCRLTRPFDILSTSMNFWKAFVPTLQRGISVRCEVYPAKNGTKSTAIPVPNALKATPTPNDPWTLSELIYEVGLPVPEDDPGNTVRKDQDIRNEWAQLILTDPNPHVSDEQLKNWRQMAKRTFIEEQDSVFGQAYGILPTVSMESENLLTDFHPERVNRDKLNSFLDTLVDTHGNNIGSLWRGWDRDQTSLRLNGAVTSGNATVSMDGFTESIGTLRKGARFSIATTSTVYVVTADRAIMNNAAVNIPITPSLFTNESDNAAIKTIPPKNFDYLFILSSSKWDRGANYKGYISMNVEDRNLFEGVEVVAGRNALQWQQPGALISNISSSISRVRSGRAIHEIAHSFGLGDEYGTPTDIKPSHYSAANLERWGNLQDSEDAMRENDQGNLVLHGDEIKWNWHRIRQAGVIDGTITSVGNNNWKVKLIKGQGARFLADDTIFIRKRDSSKPLKKNFEMMNDQQISDSFTAVDPMDTDFITIHGTILPDHPWETGDIVYAPVPAHDSSRSIDYPFAEIVSKNIKDFITDKKRPLTPEPLTVDKIEFGVQIPNIDDADLPLEFELPCWKNFPQIIGLYPGGAQYNLGIFHPAGHCMMRTQSRFLAAEVTNTLDLLSPAQKENLKRKNFGNSEFCAVCRYILVDIIDPSMHGIIDVEYERFYPQK